MYTFIYLSSQLDSEFEVLHIPPSTFRKVKQINGRSLYMYLSFFFQMWELAALVLSSFILLADCQGGMDRRKLDALISYPPIKILYTWIDLLLCSCCLILGPFLVSVCFTDPQVSQYCAGMETYKYFFDDITGQ